VSEISITRFQPAVVTREKVNSVQPVDNELGAEHTDDTPDEQGSNHKGSGKQNSDQHKSGSDTSQENISQTPASPGNSTSGRSPSVDADESPEEILEQAVTKLNRYVQTVKRDIVFDIDPFSNEPAVTVVDRESRKVLRQFDTKTALELAKQIDSEEHISLFKAEV